MPFPQGHALLIGVGTYRDEPQLNVPITAADAQALADVLRDPSLCGYPAEQVQVLRDAAAEREGILSALDALALHTDDDDTVLLFFCGHGDYGNDGDYYLTTHDTRTQGGKVVGGTGIRQSELIDKLRAIRAQRLLLLINACHSGQIGPILGQDEPAPAHIGAPLPAATAAALLATGQGRIIITACREDQVSYIGTGTLTLFGQALVDGLKGKGTSSNRGYVSAFDLYTHLYFSVEETVRASFGKTQEPELTVLKGVGPFAVALYRGATALGDFDASTPAPAGTAVREVRPDYARAMLANVAGSGAIAQGDGAVAVGERAVHVGGDNSGSITTGNQINTDGGAFVGGSLSIGGNFIGRDLMTNEVEPKQLSVGANATGSLVYPVWFGTNRKRERNGDFGSERGSAVTLGRVLVHVPDAHRVGETGNPWWRRLWRFDLRDDRLRVQAVETRAREAWLGEIQAASHKAGADGQNSHALCFLHGYNTSFQEAAIRAAQLGCDLDVPGPTAFFSWPSRGTVAGYSADEASIEASERAITEFLLDFATNSAADRVHLIAHSMGNRGLLRALQRIAADAEARGRFKLAQVFLAAPDVDRELFLDLARLYPAVSERTTLYASSADRAVHASSVVHAAPRAGYFEPYTVAAGIDTVAVPDFDVDWLGHGYFAAAEALLSDIATLMRHDEPPDQRRRIEPATDGGEPFWRLKR
jgi:esterase/lipase superfamily enzyme